MAVVVLVAGKVCIAEVSLCFLGVNQVLKFRTFLLSVLFLFPFLCLFYFVK